MSQNITPCLWLADNQIEDALAFYSKVFNGRIVNTARYPDGRLLTAHVDILGTVFMLLSGNGNVEFTQSTSFTIGCKTQAEVDHYWDSFVNDGGKESMCGWCSDKFGVSWQVTPDVMARTVGGSDRAGAARAMQAMMGMRKLIIADMEKAYAGT